MSDVKIPPPPRGLGKRGREFWRKIQADVEVDGATTDVLLEACRVLDRLDALNTVIESDGVTATGSTGQTVVHPALQEARLTQLAFTRLVQALDLPASEEEDRAFERWKVERSRKGAMVAHGYLKAVR